MAPPALAAPTGRLLVLLERSPQPRARAAAAVLARAGARRAGPQVPEIGLVTVAATPGVLAALRRDPSVASVQPEGRMTLRATANDPALTRPETAPGTPAGTPQEWPAIRQRFDRAWDFTTGAGALVGVIDTGIDGAHREFAGKVAAAVDQDASPTGGPANTDDEGHGTHVASLACAATNNGVGIAGAGRDCRLIVEKSDLTDSSIAASIVDATNRGALAINMSFGDSGNRAPVQAMVAAVDYALARNVVLVAAAADDQSQADQGQPANLLQPVGTGPSLSAGRGLSVTASTFQDRNPGAGKGTQISMAAAGAFADFSDNSGPPGLLGVAPSGQASRLDGDLTATPPTLPCGCRTTADGATFSYLQGTSMAAPQVAAIAALMRRLNPDASALDVIRLLKQTARRPAGGWTQDLGWGILDAGAAMEAAAALDRRAPQSRARAPRSTRARRFRVRWSAADAGPPGVRVSGVGVVELWRATGRGAYRRIGRFAHAHSTLVRGVPGPSYSFATVAVDAAGNREARPPRADVSVRVVGP
ncbi:MAG: serine protease [Solirubrobacteraceae bacterium]|jgi:subtilisin family serine protease|nr:serine protease [Solirubrobacteraceae bacterium]